jgi:ribosomal protein S18 acetylase RimI-like enzyme
MGKSIENEAISNRTESQLLISPNDEELLQIREIEKNTFDWEVSEEDLSALINKINDLSNITAVLRNAENEIVGYIVGMPSMNLDEEILAEDSELVPSADKLYIETLAIAKEYRGNLSQIKGLFETISSKAREDGYKIISANVPQEHLPLYERFYNAKNIRTLKNWFGSGEDHYYIQIE